TLGVNFFGLAGESGPLPMAYVEMILDRVSHRDYAWVDFLDIFNHRLLSLVARNGRKHWPVLGKKKPHEVPLGRAMVSLCGMTCLESAEIPQMSLQSFLPYATVFWNRRSTESGLVGMLRDFFQVGMLRDFFQVPVQVTPFVGCWRQLPRHVTTRIGDGIHLGNNHRLGESATLGTRYWDQGGRIQVNIGPIDKKNWKQFLPTGLAWPRLHTLIRAALSPHMDVRVKLEVEGSAFKGTRLNGQHALGWQTPLGKVYKEKQEIIVHHHFLRQE
ncbi:type VI secretion system baseplate subunit TssG, partial [Alphaproteobacteria bacterium]|nr:type VI secretion system baseplate subunit TssG [Alphaproteobacteria bacterium]